MTTCREQLKQQAMPFLTRSPALDHQWTEGEDRVVLSFQKTDSSGFDVSLTGNRGDIELSAGDFHSHFDDVPDPVELVKRALGLVRDLLSPAMRLRVGSPGTELEFAL